MDIGSINILVALSSAVMMMIAIIYILTYVLGSFSSKSGAMPLRSVLLSLLYFFGTIPLLFMGVEWLTETARIQTGTSPISLMTGASALGLTALLHFFCGFVTAFLYLRGQMSQGLNLKQAFDNILRRLRIRK